MDIKNEAVHDLVREAARRTGRSQTSVVETAVRRHLQTLDSNRPDELDELVADMQRLWHESDEPPFTAEDLYDPVTGLPA